MVAWTMIFMALVPNNASGEITITTIPENPIVIYTVDTSFYKVAPIRQYMVQQAHKYGVNPVLIDKVITCESNWKNVQSRLYNKADGGRELSFGIAQIRISVHPDISKKDALDERFAIHYMVTNIAKGNGRMWTCYRKIAPAWDGAILLRAY